MLKDYKARWYFDAETGKGDGEQKADTTPPLTPEPKAEPKKADEPKAEPFTEAQQLKVNGIAAQARQEATDRANATTKAQLEADQAKADKDKAAADLIAKGEFEAALKLKDTDNEALAEAGKVAQAKIEAYDAMAEAQLKKRLEVLGEAAKTAVSTLPGNPDILTRIKWLDENEKTFQPAEPPKGGPKRKGVNNGSEIPKEKLRKIFVGGV